MAEAITLQATPLEASIVERLRTLPPEGQQQVLDFVEFLGRKHAERRPRRSMLGVCEDLEIDLTDEDIEAARREMWRNFPRTHLLDEDP